MAPNSGSSSGELRVGIIVNTFEAVHGPYMGGYVHMLQVAKHWKNVEIVGFGPEMARGSFRRDLPNAEFVAMPSCDAVVSSRALVFLFRTFTSLLVLPKLRQCNVLFAQSHSLPDIVPAIAASRRRAITTVWHAVEAPWKRKGDRLNNWIAYLNDRLSLFLIRSSMSSVIVGTELIAKELRLTDLRVFVTTNGTGHLADGKVERRLAFGALYLGRLHPTKGVDDLIDAWKVVNNVLPETRLIIAGDGDPAYRAFLEEKVKSLQLQDVIEFVGAVDESQKRSLLRSARLFAFASKEEGWGIVLAEAMAEGLPCVTYDLQVFNEVFPVGRVSAPLYDWTALGLAMCDVLIDNVLRSRLSSEALSLAKNFTWDRAAAIELRAIKSLLQNS